MVRELQGHRVTCVDTLESSATLAAGFTTGQILLWNTAKHQMVKLLELHKMAILSLKFLASADLIMSASAEGTVSVTRVSRSFVRVSYSSTVLLKDAAVFSMDILKPDPLKSDVLDNVPLIALGAVNKAFVATVKPEPRILWEFRRNSNTRSDIVCAAWGRGALVENAENCSPVLALSWNSVVQLVEVKNVLDCLKGYEFHSHHEAAHEVLALQWIAESVLVIFTSANEARILYSGNFAQGKYREKVREEALERELIRKKSKKLTTSELEPPFKLSEDLCMQLHNLNLRTPLMLTKSSYTQAIAVQDCEVVCLLKNRVLKGRLLTWEDYMEKVKGTSSWVTILWVALEIYLGSIKGFANFPQYASIREPAVRRFMKTYITAGLKRLLPNSPDDSALHILQSTVEFCIKTAAHDFMFGQLLVTSMERGFESQYLATIEHYLFADAFQSIAVSREIVYKQVNYYVKEGKPETLERVLLFLNLRGQDLEHLAAVCIAHKMFSALIYIKTFGDDYREYVVPAECMMRELRARSKEEDKNIAWPNPIASNSCNYLGYKLLWYIQLCFKGEKFPYRENGSRINPSVWPHVIYAILNWLFQSNPSTTNEATGVKKSTKLKSESNIQTLLKVDARAVFQVMGTLFQSPELKDFVANPRSCSGGPLQVRHAELLKALAVSAQQVDSPATHAQYYFNLLLAQVAGQPGEQLDAALCMSTAKSLLGYQLHDTGQRELTEYVHEELIKDMLKNCAALTSSQLNSLVKEASKSPYIEVLIYLEETKGNYKRCFEIYLHDRRKATKVFNWLKSMWSGKGEEEVLRLIYENVERMLELSVEKTVCIVDMWFGGKHNDVVNKLSSNPKTQLEYVTVLLNNKEEFIARKVFC